jgi:26 proteasome complex subunit DSS1
VQNTQRFREAEIQSRKRESGLSGIDRNMASTTENAPKDGTEDPKLDVFEDEDEFEEFENEDWDDKEEGEDGVQQQWEDDWDDDDVTDDFSVQLRKELESAGES